MTTWQFDLVWCGGNKAAPRMALPTAATMRTVIAHAKRNFGIKGRGRLTQTDFDTFVWVSREPRASDRSLFITRLADC